jgi:hypothetical protein
MYLKHPAECDFHDVFGPLQTLFIVLWALWDEQSCYWTIVTYTLFKVWQVMTIARVRDNAQESGSESDS